MERLTAMSKTKDRFKRLSALKKAVMPLIAVLLLAGIVVWTTGLLHERIPPETIPHKPGFPLPDDAEIYTVEKKPVLRLVDVTGTVSSERMVRISARINAYVDDVHANAGSVVSAGDRLVSLDDRELLEKRSAARAALNQAETEYNRTKRLLESGAATHQSYIAAQSAYERARARKEEVGVMLSFTEMRSPIDGIVTDRHIETGDLASPGLVLMSVYDPAAMRLEAPVPARLANRISVGDEMRVQLEYPEARFKGTVTEIVSKIDPASRTRTVRIRLPAENADILPGAFGRIWVERVPEDGIFVPATAVFRLGQLEMVQSVTDGRVTRRLVKTGQARDSFIEILSGLQDGDTILLYPVPATPADPIPSPQNNLSPGR